MQPPLWRRSQVRANAEGAKGFGSTFKRPITQKELLMFDAKQKAIAINNLGTVAGIKANAENVQLMDAVIDKVIEVGVAEVTAADITNVKVEVDGKEKGLTEPQSAKVFAAVEFHRNILVASKKVAVKKPTIIEQYKAETPVSERDEMAVKVAEKRINVEGTKPIAWKKIRDSLGLKLDEFHKVIRHSSGWLEAVVDRITALEAQEGGWTYNGKLDVLTGIDNFEFYREELETQRANAEEHTVPQALSA